MSTIASVPCLEVANAGGSNNEIVGARRNNGTDSSGSVTGDGENGQFQYVFPYDFFRYDNRPCSQK